MKRHIFHPEAEVEFLEALVRFSEESQSVGQRFYHAIRNLVDDVCRTPAIFRRVALAPQVRRHFKTKFPYAVLYVEEPDRIVILAVAHFKRRPGYWRNRLNS